MRSATEPSATRLPGPGVRYLTFAVALLAVVAIAPTAHAQVCADCSACADGTACDDGVFCTVGETCTAGVCGGSFLRDCSNLNTQCSTGVCVEAAAACQAQPANQGLACNDNNACTLSDTCNAGTCTGTPIVACNAPRVVVANRSSSTVSIVRSTDLVVEASPATGLGPQQVAITPDATAAYVTNNVGDSVSVINLVTNTAGPTIAVGLAPTGVAVRPDGQVVYVANSASDSISLIATASNSVTGSVQLDPLGTLPPFSPFGVAVTPDGAFVYVSNNAKNTVTVMRTSDNLLLTELSVGRRPQGVAVSPDGVFAYVANAGDGNVSVIRVLDHAVLGNITVGTEPFGVAFTPDGAFAFVTNSLANTVSKVNVSQRRVAATIPVAGQPTGIAVKGSGDRAYVASTSLNRVSAIDVANSIVIGSPTTVGTAPSGVAVAPMTILHLAGAVAPTTVAPGDPVTFTFSYSNSGARPGQGVTLSATVPGNSTFVSASTGGTVSGSTVSWAIGTLAAGATGQVSFVVNARRPLPPNALVTSTGTVVDSQGTSAQATVSARINSNPMYSLGKVEDVDPAVAGGPITYTISYANNAAANADGEGVVINETYDQNFTFVSAVPPPIPGTNSQWAIGALPVGASGTIQVTGTVRSPLGNGTILQNVVTMRDTFNNQVTASQNTGVTSSPTLGVALADDRDPAGAGTLVTYSVNYTNTGNANATGVVARATYDPNVVFVSSIPAPDPGTTNRWTIGALNVGTSGVIAITARIAGILPNGTILTNSIDLSDAAGDFATAAQNTTVSSAPTLALSVGDSPDPVATGNTLTYTITYANTGTDVATGVSILAAYDPGVLFVSAVPSPTVGDNQWDVGIVPVGGGGTIVVTTQVTAPLGSIANTQVTVSDAIGNSSSATANTTVQITPVLTFAITDSADPIGAGGLLTYTVRYGNAGNAPATNTVLGLVYDPHVTFVAAAPPPDAGSTSQWTLGTVNDGITGQIAVTVRVESPLANGTILSSQGVVAADGGLVAAGAQSTTVQSSPALGISMTDSPDPVGPGATITYTIAYTNSGNDGTTGVVVTEAYDALETFVSAVPPPDSGTNNRWTIGSLAGGSGGSIEVTVRVPVVVNGTPVTNTATIRDDAGRNGTATENSIISSPIFSLTASDDTDPVGAGDEMVFTLDYGNISGAQQGSVVVHAVLDPSFGLEEATPPADAGTGDTWTLGTLGAGQTGRITLRGFFGNSIGGSLAQTRFDISNANGTAFAAEATAVQAAPLLTIRRLAMRQSTRSDSWALRVRFVPPADLQPDGQEVAISVFGPGGVQHTAAFVVPGLEEFRIGRLKYVGDVPRNGKTRIILEARHSGNWVMSIKARGADILAPFPAETLFLVRIRFGTVSFLSEAEVLRERGSGTSRRFP